MKNHTEVPLTENQKSVHLIMKWLPSRPGTNTWVAACGVGQKVYALGCSFTDKVTCADCLKSYEFKVRKLEEKGATRSDAQGAVDAQFDEFAALPQTAREVE